MLPKNLWKFLALRGDLARNLNGENKMAISSIVRRNYSKKESDFEADLNKPVKYTTSPAYEWRASNSRIGSKAEFGPWYESHLTFFSIGVFLIYFCILREENDIDKFLEKPLSEMKFKDD